MLNDNEICKEILKSWKEIENDLSIDAGTHGLLHAKKMIAEGLTTPEQLDRCAKQMIEHTMKTGIVPDSFDEQDLSDLR